MPLLCPMVAALALVRTVISNPILVNMQIYSHTEVIPCEILGGS